MADASAVSEAPQTTPEETAAPSPVPSADVSAPAAEPAAPPTETPAPPADDAAPAPASDPQAQPADENPAGVEVRPARLSEAKQQTNPAGGGQVDILLGATMPVTASLGQVSIQVRHLLQLGPGSVVKLDRQTGEPIDLFLRGVKFATGQLVVVGEHLGVRIREILPAAVEEGTVGPS
jgi:flagellar motor switch protein FliN